MTGDKKTDTGNKTIQKNKGFAEKTAGTAFFLYAVFVLLITANNILSPIFFREDHCFKKEFLLPEIVLPLVGAVIVFVLIRVKKRLGKAVKFNIWLASIVLLAVQLFICGNIIFTTNTWDAGIVSISAYNLVHHPEVPMFQDYFTFYSNNRLILLVFTALFRLFYNIPEGMCYTWPIVAVQCILSVVTGILVYNILKDMCRSKLWAAVGWFLYVLVLGLSGWNCVTYTDIMGLVFPVLIFRVYQRELEPAVKYPLIALLSYWGYKMRPQVLIVLIAVVLTQTVFLAGPKSKISLKQTLLAAVLCVLVTAASAFAFSQGIKYIGVRDTNVGNAGIVHMLMLGVNTNTDGTFSNEDEQFTLGLESSARTKAQFEEYKRRLSAFTPKSFLNHFRKKALVSFNDGSFAWGEEGGFFDNVYPDKIPYISAFLKQLYYKDGKYFKIMLTFLQMLWLGILLASAGMVLCRRDRQNMALALSLAGIIMFVMIFEARARYLIIYVPFFVIAAVNAAKSLAKR